MEDLGGTILFGNTHIDGEFGDTVSGRTRFIDFLL